MRRNYIIIFLLVLFVLGSLGTGFAALYPYHDEVQFTQTTLYGDPKAAEGLKITYSTYFAENLFWDTTWTVGTDPDSAESDYQFFAQDQDVVYRPDYGVDLETSEYIECYINEVPSGLQRAFDELAVETGAVEKKEKNIKLADYYDYYPLSAVIEFPEIPQICFSDRIIKNEQVLAIAEEFREFFKIPVLPQDSLQIEISTGRDGQVVSSTRVGSDTSWYMETVSTYTDDACYFTFDTRASQDEIVDTSLIPGGYGIYCLPLDTENGTVKAEQLSMVYSLQPGIEIESLSVNRDQSLLYLITQDGEFGEISHRVIDLDTYETIQVLEFPGADDIYDSMIHYSDDFAGFYVQTENDSHGYLLYNIEEDGSLKEAFFIDGKEEATRNLFQFASNYSVAFDGERLAVSGNSSSGRTWWNGSFSIAVFDETGLLYCGEYFSNQNPASEPQGNWYCYTVDSAPPQVSW